MFRCLVPRVFTLLPALLVAASSQAAPMTGDWVAKWRDDLHVARKALEERHPALFHSVTSEALDAAFARLSARLPQLEHHQAVVELAAIVALIGDGHTRLTLPLGPGVDFEQGHSSTPPPALDEMRLHQLPLRLAVDDQGPWVERATPRHRDLVGARLLAIDGRPVAEVIAAVEPTIRRDNEWQVLHHLPMHLVLPELLHARGVLARPEGAELTVRELDGRERRVTVERLPFGEPVEWVGPLDGVELPPSLRETVRNFELTYLEHEATLYLRFDEVYNEPDESIRALAARITEEVAQRGAGRPVDKLVIDLRRNRGGDGSLLEPLLRAVIASPLNETGHLYALIGRATFSAAMFLVLDLEDHTEVIFAGEPTGSKPNHYGDSRKIQLPNTGLTLRVSTLYWQSHPRDSREAITPQIAVPNSRDDMLAGRDPVLETVLAQRAPAGGVDWIAASRWKGEVRTGSGAFPWALDLEGGAAPPTATVDLPALGLERVTALELEPGPDGLSFGVPFDGGVAYFRGKALGQRLFGTLEVRGSLLPAFLESTGAGEED